MATATEIALALLPKFSKNVLAAKICDYSYYAKVIGRNPAKEMSSARVMEQGEVRSELYRGMRAVYG